jgi:cytochrome P450
MVEASIADPPVFNPFDAQWRADPYPFYKRLREMAPVGRVPIVGSWYVTRFADCLKVLHSPTAGVDLRKAEDSPKAAGSATVRRADDVTERRSFLFLDPPDHTRLRGLVSRAFTARVVAGMHARLQGHVDRLLDAAEARGNLEIIDDLAYPLPFTVIAELLGIPISDLPLFRKWDREMAGANDPTLEPAPEVVERQQRAVREGVEYLQDIIRQRQRKPADDMISMLIAARLRDDKLSEDELIASVTLLVAAGHATTVNLIGNAVLALLQHPDQLAQLRAEPALAERAVEETLRWDPPVQLTRRIALQDLQVATSIIPKGASISVVLGAAGRDEAVAPDGERFDLRRHNIRHLSFGGGPHFCLGASLARAEAAAALTGLATRYPQLRLRDGDSVQRRTDLVMRGLKALPVEI